MSDNLPVEVVREILLRLPVKPLLKCRCVSKTWDSIISDPTFITTHLTRTLTKTTTTNNMLLYHDCFDLRSRNENEHLALYLNDSTETFTLNNVPPNCPLKSINSFLHVVGSCNGVLCLSDDYFGYNDNGYALWNPSINKLVKVPDPNICDESHGAFVHSLGFGFDAVNNDYKIVRVVYIDDGDGSFNKLPPLVEIFSLRSGSWRDVSAPSPNYVIDERSLQAFVNGASHWIAHSDMRKCTDVNVIVSFDLENEIFSEMKMPESLVEEFGLTMVIEVFRGSLALLPWPYANGETLYSVWVMKEYGAAESWSKLFNIDLHGELQRVVAFRKNGEVLVVTRNEKLLSYDPKNQKYSDLGIWVNSRSFYINTYVESLVLLNEANGEWA